MQEFIVHAPIQTRQNSLNKHERLLAFLSAEALNRITEYQTGKPIPRADLWNTIGVKSEKDWANANTAQPIEYRRYHAEQIDARYQILADVYGIPKDGRAIMTDGDEQYQAIVIEQVKQRIASHDFFVSRAKFTHCVPCDYVIAPSMAEVNKCPLCNRSNLDLLETEGLFTSTSTETRRQIVDQVDIYPRSARKLMRQTVFTMPDLVLLSKQRQFGTRLTEFGVDDRFVLDPKIPLALMGHVVKEMGIGRIKGFIQGIDSIGNLAPYTYLVDPGNQYAFINTGLVPHFGTDTFTDSNLSFYTSFLPLIMISTPGGVDQYQVDNYFKEYERTCRQFNYVVPSIEQLATSGTVETDNNLHFPTQDIFSLFNKYQTREAISLFKERFYTYFSRDYLNRCRKDKTVPTAQVIQQLKDIFSLIYHQ